MHNISIAATVVAVIFCAYLIFYPELVVQLFH
jgi:hypothetical protein